MRHALLLLAAFSLLLGCAQPNVSIDGPLAVWHRVELTFSGPETSETATPNPFTDYRLDVAFTGPGGAEFLVPGFFAADGDAAESSAEAGDKWRVRFLPNAPGEWRYTASFRMGDGIAVDAADHAGTPTAFDGASGSFQVAPADIAESVIATRDFRRHGLLEHVGDPYPRFAGSGLYFLKNGADSPENLLAYADFDGTRDNGVSKLGPDLFLHQYEPHVADWQQGDPAWQDGKGKGLVGGLNYLSSRGVNSIYFLTQNVNGDGNDVWPWLEPDGFDRFDVSKLAQWEVVFSHAQRLGILLHVLTAETENDRLLDGGELGPERRLYYRELIARFAHHPALIWNLGEENRNTTAQQKAFGEYLHATDPYQHPVVLHTHSTPKHHEAVYGPLLGSEHLDGASMQIKDDSLVREILMEWMSRSKAAGHPWLVAFDEQRTGNTGVATDEEDPERFDERRDHLYATFMAGSWGIEWYFGYDSYPHDDVNLEDWRTRDVLWAQSNHAVEFFHARLPFWDMRPADDVTTDPADLVLAKPGEIYAIYSPDGAAEVELPPGDFAVEWFNPRSGGKAAAASPDHVGGPGRFSLRPPDDSGPDWLLLLERR